MKKIKLAVTALIILAMAAALVSCAAADSAQAPMAAPGSGNFATANMLAPSASAPAAPAPPPEMAMDQGREEYDSGFMTGGGEGSIPPSYGSRMIATTFDISAETRDFDTSVEFIRSAVHGLGGYIENSSVQGRSLNHFDAGSRWANFTVRIPAQNIHQFVGVVRENYNVTHQSESADDITETYFDSASRLASLENHERLLHELLERDGDLEHIMLVYNEIANVRWQIERINSSLQSMEGRVNFSTVNISLQEVMEYREVSPMPLSFGERIDQAWAAAWSDFERHMQNWATGTVRNLPFMIMDFLGFLFWVAVFIFVRRIIRKRKGRGKGEPTFDWLRLPVNPKRGGKEAIPQEKDND